MLSLRWLTDIQMGISNRNWIQSGREGRVMLERGIWESLIGLNKHVRKYNY